MVVEEQRGIERRFIVTWPGPPRLAPANRCSNVMPRVSRLRAWETILETLLARAT